MWCLLAIYAITSALRISRAEDLKKRDMEVKIEGIVGVVGWDWEG